ncbi:magnesium protoporphyrin IX methyltransferase [Pseudanabaena sp. FACHB-1277]|uniref:Magnesium protoporphyrin IX methyltransferase n=1 Tax=Pseudanabaena cinerea FACHB-1277 TaxID=2949581 RepID=A0A926UUU1_9CYAN|nr:magnesium protoporphyrin IX methyltransferase [Pseudanabaena cinerea]MBD2151674.1 magnesium protoporphyrin IX methyltransferase [Pseudanabaena cinerea FACHB-1277]
MANKALKNTAPSDPKDKQNDKQIVRDYFNSTGFDRWRRIYGEGEVNRVQRDIRTGHQQTVDYVLSWFKNDQNAVEQTVCDAGCGTGSLSIPLAAMGAKVYASDISEKMVGEGKANAVNPENPIFEVNDLAKLSGEYDTVICLDVLIHYPDRESEQMIAHLASLAKSRLILSFAPKNPYYVLMKKVGDMVPGPSKATRAYLHKEADVRRVLKELGFKIKRQEFTATSFYFSRLLEAVRN